MRPILVAGNWKMNGSLASVRELLADLKAGLAQVDKARLAVFPPFPYLAETQAALADTGIAWGGQNVSEHTSGAYTGEVAPAMLQDFGCRYVLVGHSERRTLYGEDDAIVVRKTLTALAAGLTPVVCIGETLEEREAGTTEAVVGRQVAAVLDGLDNASLRNVVLAYEPVWAIGTGKTATPQQAQAVHAFIRHKIVARDAGIGEAIIILYGGSVKSANAGELFAMPDIDGGLVGGASLQAAEFLGIATSI